MSVDAKEGCDGALVKLCADDAKATDDIGSARADADLLGYVVEVDPRAVLARYDTLRAKHGSVLAAVKGVKRVADLVLGKGLRSFATPIGEYLVGMVVVMMLVVMMVATALALVIVVMVMLMLVMVAAALALVIVVMVMLMLVMVAAALALFIVVMMVLMIVMVTAAFALVIVMMVVLMLVMVAAAFALVIVVMMVVMLSLLGKLLKLARKGILLLHSGENCSAVKGIPRGGDDSRLGVMLTQKCYRLFKLFLVHARRAAENDGARVCDLVTVELAEIFKIYAALGGVGDGGEAVEKHVLSSNALHGVDHVGKLTDARGLDKNTVGMEFVKHLAKGLGEVAHKAAADASAVHFGDLDARLAEKSAVDADLAELVFNKNHLLSHIGR